MPRAGRRRHHHLSISSPRLNLRLFSSTPHLLIETAVAASYIVDHGVRRFRAAGLLADAAAGIGLLPAKPVPGSAHHSRRFCMSPHALSFPLDYCCFFIATRLTAFSLLGQAALGLAFIFPVISLVVFDVGLWVWRLYSVNRNAYLRRQQQEQHQQRLLREQRRVLRKQQQQQQQQRPKNAAGEATTTSASR